MPDLILDRSQRRQRQMQPQIDGDDAPLVATRRPRSARPQLAIQAPQALAVAQTRVETAEFDDVTENVATTVAHQVEIAEVENRTVAETVDEHTVERALTISLRDHHRRPDLEDELRFMLGTQFGDVSELAVEVWEGGGMQFMIVDGVEATLGSQKYEELTNGEFAGLVARVGVSEFGDGNKRQAFVDGTVGGRFAVQFER